MKRRTVEELIAANRAFYSSRAVEFDVSRRSPWPGWTRVLDRLDRDRRPSILDVGCGNGRFGRFADRQLAGRLEYWGVDSSGELLDAAREAGGPTWNLIEAELMLADFPHEVETRRFDLVACFGVMHHVPGEATRRRMMERMAARVAARGLLTVSFWQFGRKPRFRRRALDWSDLRSSGVLDLEETELEPGDYILRWGDQSEAGAALRYCHFCDSPEIERLTVDLGLERLESFSADGQSGDLNRYVVLRRD